MELKFGKYKGREISDIAKSDRGREYLRWLADQPTKNNKYAEENQIRNKKIQDVLSLYSGEDKITAWEKENKVSDGLTETAIKVKINEIKNALKEIESMVEDMA